MMIFLYFLLASLFNLAQLQQVNNEARLHQYLFGSVNGSVYNPNLRPVLNSSAIMQVDARLGVKRIFEMDESSHRVTLFAILFKKWKDEYLTWDPAQFDGITYTYVNYDQIWTPKLQLISKYLNEQSKPTDFSTDDLYANFPIRVNYDGSVNFAPQLHLSSECLFTYDRFPFDVQVCTFVFQMPYDSDTMKLVLNTYYTREFYNYDNIWEIADISSIPSTDPENNPISIILFKFKRKVRNYLYTLPSYVVYILTLLMFLLPQTSNQRIIIGSISLIIATLLTYMMSNEMPKADVAAWPLLGKMYLFNIVLLTFAILFSAFIINIVRAEHVKSVPDWLKRFTLNFLSRIFFIQSIAYTVFNSFSFKTHDEESMANQEQITNQLVEVDDDVYQDLVVVRSSNENQRSRSNEQAADETNNNINNNQTSQQDTADASKQSLTKLLKRIHEHMEQIRYRMQKETYKNCTSNEWMLVGSLVDKILFFVYCSIVIFCTLTIFRN